MPKCIVYYRYDGKISTQHPGFHKKPVDMPDGVFLNMARQRLIKNRPEFAELEHSEIDDSILPNSDDPTNRKDRDRWRGTKATGIKIDKSVVLRGDLVQELDAELLKTSPDLITVERIKRKLEKREHE